jgi:hypothetical protein
MTSTTYSDAVGEALERLRGVGYEWGPSFANHAPMAAEALARMGYADEVPGWVERNLRKRRYHDAPEQRWALTAGPGGDWESALGDFGRVGDWAALFERELAAEPWRDVLARWWPRLLPGMSGALTHGVIRTAHAVRALALSTGDDDLQRGELAQGLGYWAARYSGSASRPVPTVAEPGEPLAADENARVLAAFDAVIADASAGFVGNRQSFPVPLIHSITAPAAVRLVCEYLPQEQRQPSYETAQRVSGWIRSRFAAPQRRPSPTVEPNMVPSVEQLVATAVEIGDEHAIKLAEVAVRQHALTPDDRYLVASQTANTLISRFPA